MAVLDADCRVYQPLADHRAQDAMLVNGIDWTQAIHKLSRVVLIAMCVAAFIRCGRPKSYNPLQPVSPEEKLHSCCHQYLDLGNEDSSVAHWLPRTAQLLAPWGEIPGEEDHPALPREDNHTSAKWRPD